MSKNPVTDNLKKYLESEQRRYGTDFCNSSKKTESPGGSRYTGSEKGDKYGTIGDKRYK